MINSMLVNYHEIHPNVSISIRNTTEVVEQILLGESDFGITIGPIKNKNIISIPLYEDELVLIVQKNSPIAKQKYISFADLPNLKLVMMSNDHPCRKKIDSHCKEIGVPFQILIETSNPSSLIQLIRNNVGVSVTSKIPIEMLGDEDIHWIPFHEVYKKDTLCLIYRKDKFIGNAGRDFIQLLNQTIKQLTKK